jgi:nucleoside-diphosphate-sugar epimerase
MKCFVTGAAGFVGSSLCDRLLKDGHTVVGVDSFVPYYDISFKKNNLHEALNDSRFTFIEADIATMDLTGALQGIDLIFHQAGQAGVRASWGGEFSSYIHNNITATQKLLEVVREMPAIKKVVFASSSSVYGNAETFPTSEKARPQPVSPYGVTKLASEHLMTLYASQYGVPTVSLRYFTVFGPRQRPDMAFHRFAHAGLTKSPITIYGDGTQSRDFTYIDDIVEANILAAKHGAPGEVFNIGGGTQSTINDVLSILRDLIGPLDVKYSAKQRGDAAHTSADTSKAIRQLNFSPKFSLLQGLTEEVKWFEKLLSNKCKE